MKIFFRFLICSFALIISVNTSPVIAGEDFLSYVDPVPGAEYVNSKTTIIFRTSKPLDRSSLKKSGSVRIYGSIKGVYEFTFTECREENTYIIKPSQNFSYGEEVTVDFSSGIKYSSGKNIEPTSVSFKIRSADLPVRPLEGLRNEISESDISKLLQTGSLSDDPVDFPQITVSNSNDPAPGKLLVSNLVFNTQIPNTPYLIILKNDGTPVFSRQMTGNIFNFDRQPNGMFTYYNIARSKYFGMDSAYNVVDSFYTGNGYETDLHELRVLPNGHAMLMSYDRLIVDMSVLVQGGNPMAVVTGLILQEIDENKNVVFQWRSWDHIPITDATHENMLAGQIDYIHGNALELDNDGNWLLSSRHLEEITKINRSNGNIIWRLGGKWNAFTFINDPIKFSYQHGIRRLPNGHIILFDNGNYHSPQFSRAVEYILDEVNHQVTLFWEYRNTPVIYGYAMGIAQRLQNGNTLISWGATNPSLTEVKPDGTKSLQVTFSSGVFTYRAFKYEWDSRIVGIEPVNNEIPLNYKLEQNYPNPFNPSTKIKFSLPKNGYTDLRVYDELGRIVKILVNGDLKQGSYEIDFNSLQLSSGIYFYRLSSADFSETRKMLLIK